MNGNKFQLIIKKVIDILLGCVLLVLTAPVFIIIAAAIKLNSKGKVIFKQERIGKNRKKFNFYKFRTMDENCGDTLHRKTIHFLMTNDIQQVKAKKELFKSADDPRVTAVGKFLRKCSLDELPQLFNVIKGQMSLVGPRPAIEYELEYYDEIMLKRFSVMPGITGLWQISSCPKFNYRQMVKMDLFYIKNWSLLLDLKIFLKTFLVVFKKRGVTL
ncbi:MAG: sugar transferase [Candidatus Omnitrophota bacterium]